MSVKDRYAHEGLYFCKITKINQHSLHLPKKLSEMLKVQ